MSRLLQLEIPPIPTKRRREATGTESRASADALLIKRMGEAGVGKTPQQDLKTLRYEDLKDAYLRDHPNQGANHLKPLNEFFSGMKVLRITTDTIRDFIDERCEGGKVSPPTARRDLVLLRAMFNQARKENKIGANDIPYFPMPSDSEPAGQ